MPTHEERVAWSRMGSEAARAERESWQRKWRMPGRCRCGRKVVCLMLPFRWVDPETDKPCTHGELR